MNNKIREHVEFLFQNAPNNMRALELKEELIANLIDRYGDLIQRGETEETAYNVVISGIGDVDELIRGLRDYDMYSPGNVLQQRQKSAVLIALSVALYIISFIFPIIFNFFLSGRISVIGSILMLLCWAFATGLLVYNAMSKPKYVKMEETIVEDFKEWKSYKNKSKALYQSLHSLVWLITVPLYLCLGFFFDAWSPGWLVFLLAPIANVIIRLVFAYKEEE